jgi:hypothetical protein
VGRVPRSRNSSLLTMVSVSILLLRGTLLIDFLSAAFVTCKTLYRIHFTIFFGHGRRRYMETNPIYLKLQSTTHIIHLWCPKITPKQVPPLFTQLFWTTLFAFFWSPFLANIYVPMPRAATTTTIVVVLQFKSFFGALHIVNPPLNVMLPLIIVTN